MYSCQTKHFLIHMRARAHTHTPCRKTEAGRFGNGLLPYKQQRWLPERSSIRPDGMLEATCWNLHCCQRLERQISEKTADLRTALENDSQREEGNGKNNGIKRK